VEGHEHTIHFPRNNEPCGGACTSIWRMSRESNTAGIWLTPEIGETLVRPYFSGFCNVG